MFVKECGVVRWVFPFAFNWGFVLWEGVVLGVIYILYSLSSKNMVWAMGDLTRAWYWSFGRCWDPLSIMQTSTSKEFRHKWTFKCLFAYGLLPPLFLFIYLLGGGGRGEEGALPYLPHKHNNHHHHHQFDILLIFGHF